MTIREEAQWCIQRDGMLAEIRKKLKRGTATYEDTAAYSARAGKMIGALLSRRLPEIPTEEREQLCVELLHDRYIDINAAVDAAQRQMDKMLGIQIAPQHAPFDSERGHQIGSSLRDLSKPVETLQRRAKAAIETATKAMHDDRMKTEEKFRSRAGLKCFITRKAVNGCCPWCTAMAGRYEYGEEPDDVYRRHDNCDCTVTFENGRKRQDVWSKREWEVPEPGAGAGDPVVLTKEQAAELQGRNRLINKRLTLDDKRAILSIKADEFTPCLRDMKTGQLVQTEVAKVPRTKLKKYKEADGWGVDWDKRPDNEYVLGVFLENDTEPQGLISVRPDHGGLYMGFASTAPHNNPQFTGGTKMYSGVGGHLFAAAVQESVRTGCGGCVYGYAANKELLQYYVNEFGAQWIPIHHDYQIIIDGDAAQRLIDIYDFNRR